ncbi:MAG TPA: hypothetical protein VNS09_18575 [Solirubrobacter sp.]|nr:hypothetical protein [Solirubrobacter sp.]
MSDIGDQVARSDIVALAARIQELEAQLIRTPGRALEGDTDCTHCNTDCTHCPGDRFLAVLLPGEAERLSGGALVKQLRAGRS